MKVKVKGVRKIAVTGEYIRLDALIKYAAAAATGGEAKQLIQGGSVKVNGEICLLRGRKIRFGDIVSSGRETLLVVENANEGK